MVKYMTQIYSLFLIIKDNLPTFFMKALKNNNNILLYKQLIHEKQQLNVD